MRTQVIRTQQRIEITNKNNVQAEMTLTTVDQTVLATADAAALCQREAFCGHEITIYNNNMRNLLNRNSGI